MCNWLKILSTTALAFQKWSRLCWYNLSSFISVTSTWSVFENKVNDVLKQTRAHLRRKMVRPLRFYHKLFSWYVHDSKTWPLLGGDFLLAQRRQHSSPRNPEQMTKNSKKITINPKKFIKKSKKKTQRPGLLGGDFALAQRC